MNYTQQHSNGSGTARNGNGAGASAAALASLTRELAHCCLDREAELFHRFGLTSSEGVVLLQVAQAGTTLPSNVACSLGLARSRLTPLTANLVEKGFLHRRESAKDRRQRELTLTEKGHEVASAADHCRLDFHQRLLERYPEPERDRLLETLTQLHRSMEDLRHELKA